LLVICSHDLDNRLEVVFGYFRLSCLFGLPNQSYLQMADPAMWEDDPFACVMISLHRLILCRLDPQDLGMGENFNFAQFSQPTTPASPGTF
jgi:hypothetical protein